MSLAGLLGPSATWRGLTKPRKDIMGDGEDTRNGLVWTGEKVLPGQHPWSEGAGKRLAHFRESAGLSQPELADLADVSTGTISNLERARTRPARGNLEAVAAALGISVAALLPAETKEATAFQEGVAHALDLVEAMLADLRRSLGPDGDGGFGLRVWLAHRNGEQQQGGGTEGLG